MPGLSNREDSRQLLYGWFQVMGNVIKVLVAGLLLFGVMFALMVLMGVRFAR